MKVCMYAPRRTVTRGRTCALWRSADKVCMYAPAARLPAIAHVHCGVLPPSCVYHSHSERYSILRRLYTRLAQYLCEQYTVTQGRQSGKRLMPKVAFNYVRTFVNMCRDHMSENTHLSKGTCACACALAYMFIPSIHVHMHVHVCTSIYMHI